MAPVTKLASSLARNVTTAAISSGCPSLPHGVQRLEKGFVVVVEPMLKMGWPIVGKGAREGSKTT